MVDLALPNSGDDCRFIYFVAWCGPLVPQVVITSDSRSISQAFWGAEHAKDKGGGLEASTMQGTITHLETEIAR